MMTWNVFLAGVMVASKIEVQRDVRNKKSGNRTNFGGAGLNIVKYERTKWDRTRCPVLESVLL